MLEKGRMSASPKKSVRFVTCLYKGNLRSNLRGCTGHARPAETDDGPAVAGLWAFQLGGEGDIFWVRAVDLAFLGKSKRKR